MSLLDGLLRWYAILQERKKIIFVGLCLVSFIGYFSNYFFSINKIDFCLNLFTEGIGIIGSYLIINKIVQHYEDRRQSLEKESHYDELIKRILNYFISMNMQIKSIYATLSFVLEQKNFDIIKETVDDLENYKDDVYRLVEIDGDTIEDNERLRIIDIINRVDTQVRELNKLKKEITEHRIHVQEGMLRATYNFIIEYMEAHPNLYWFGDTYRQNVIRRL